MKPVAIVKAGSTFPTLSTRKGDFEDWIQLGLGLSPERTVIIDVQKCTPLPEYDQVSGIVVSGSHASVTDHLDWSERTSGWLAGAVAKEIPILGICYGHQLLAYALGGQVGDNPNGLEFGTIDVHLTKSAQSDRLLACLRSPLKAQLCHAQSVLQLPDGARRLASSSKDATQAFVVGTCAWGVQFHPEFDAEVVAEYIKHVRLPLRAEGQDAERLLETCTPTPHSASILSRFAQLVDGW